MKNSKGFRRRRCTPPGRRTQLLAAFDQSGLSAAAFARQQHIGYSPFCGWRHRQAQTQSSSAFVEVELPGPAAEVELLIELGPPGRLRITAVAQIELAARFLQRFNALASG